MSVEKYQPTPEEIQKAEESMTAEEKEMSKKREMGIESFVLLRNHVKKSPSPEELSAWARMWPNVTPEQRAWLKKKHKK